MAKCIYPIYLPNREVPVPCRKCGTCLQTRKQEWQFRLQQEAKVSDSAYFVTLTYSDEYVPVKNGQESLELSDLQKFFKRLRKRHALHSKSQIRYYAVGEYGTRFKRPHYHIILFNAVREDVENSWPCGFLKFDKVSFSSIGYVVGYVTSVDDDSVNRGVSKQFAVMSRKPGLGYNYLRTHGKWHKDGLRNFTKVNGEYGKLPETFKKKIFDREQQTILMNQALKSYDDNYHFWYNLYKTNSHPDPPFAIREMELAHERRIYQNILNIKLQL